MEYDFLFDKARHLLAIGYNVGERRRDSSYYDLLASEARLCSFVAIAQGQLPQESWFALGRLLTTAGGEPILLSWSGSMFEYLMPLLVMPTYENTLLDQTYKAAVERQIEYGRQRGVPWGISESGYNTIDVHLNYQYRAFGVPGLGLKRGLAEDLVIAPYASALALMVAPEEACLNLQRLAAAGLEGRFGFYEAIDYTPSRLPRGQSSAVVRSYMAHHQGMSLLSLAYLLLDRPMQKRFESDPLFQATMLLLQERIPKATAFYSHTAELSDIRTTSGDAETPVRVFSSPAHADAGGAAVVERQIPRDGHERGRRVQPLEGPRRHALARRQYLRQLGHVLLHPRRGERGVLVNGLSADAQTAEELRSRFFRRVERNFAAATTRSTRIPRSWCRRKMTSNCAESASPTARGTSRTIDITSYAEVVLALLCRGRAASGVQQSVCSDRDHSRTAGDPLYAPAALPRRAVALDVSPDGRARRGRSERCPMRRTACSSSAAATPSPTPACDGPDRCALSGSQGSVLDPIVAIRYRITSIRKNRQRSIWCPASAKPATSVWAWSRNTRIGVSRIASSNLAWTHSQVVLRQLNATEADAQLYGRLASSIIYANSSLRADAERPHQEPPRPIRSLGLRHFRRSADRAAADRRPGQYRSGAPTRSGARLLALEGTGRGPGDLERRSRRLPATAPGTDHGADCRGRRSARDGSAGRHLRAAGGADIERGPHSAAIGRTCHYHR